jgi:NAD(P)-dependent dehydrogenase (short-subunit alcohol dehydrogenase family)
MSQSVSTLSDTTNSYVETPLLLQAMSQAPTSQLSKDVNNTPLGRVAKMEEIGDSITFLASPLSSFMQGAAMIVDGGFSTQ